MGETGQLVSVSSKCPWLIPITAQQARGVISQAHDNTRQWSRRSAVVETDLKVQNEATAARSSRGSQAYNANSE